MELNRLSRHGPRHATRCITHEQWHGQRSSQLAQATCLIALPTRHLTRQVAYIDTEHTFRPDRIRPIAVRFGLDADAVLDNVRSLVTPWPKCLIGGPQVDCNASVACYLVLGESDRAQEC